MSETNRVSYVWHEASHPPESRPIRQVYAYVFDARGRVIVLRDNGVWNLPGGTPEPEDGGDRVATLVREVWEEVQVTITDPVHLGYQAVHRPDREPYAQLRMAARLNVLGEREPDPDSGRIHVRRLCPFPEAVELLGWGPSVDGQVKCAAMTAVERWGLPVGAPAETYTD
ncbi:NUDIX hydrolase [Nocardiopsis sp. LDBS1602]|uniref:NUDIX hydrolase n=1 Tax=Nocardiopsis sp. LDBS1602 TaxID=3109597 RepID=UPI002DB678BD|nr:NUDIX domain-containing protein [Nocardiopsis sp. LDBS1602]MEC3891683.1 NUDIX domain-containing protein [Nocardiopsis sp. LDBS1602]